MIYHNKANSYFDEGLLDEAENFYKLSIKERPRFISQKDLAELYLEKGDYPNCYQAGVKALDYYDDTK